MLHATLLASWLVGMGIVLRSFAARDAARGRTLSRVERVVDVGIAASWPLCAVFSLGFIVAVFVGAVGRRLR